MPFVSECAQIEFEQREKLSPSIVHWNGIAYCFSLLLQIHTSPVLDDNSFSRIRLMGAGIEKVRSAIDVKMTIIDDGGRHSISRLFSWFKWRTDWCSSQCNHHNVAHRDVTQRNATHCIAAHRNTSRDWCHVWWTTMHILSKELCLKLPRSSSILGLSFWKFLKIII